MKTLLAFLAAVPLAVFAQSTGPGPGRGMGMGPGAGMGMGHGPGRGDPERMEKRARLARTLGLAEALDLDAPQALKLGEAIARYDERRLAAHKQLHEAHLVLQKAAQGGEKTAAAEVDQAIQKALDARQQLQAIDREMVSTVTKDLAPEKKARAVLFLERFQRRFAPGPAARMGPGMRMGPARGARGPRAGMGPGPGGPMADACLGGDCDWAFDEE